MSQLIFDASKVAPAQPLQPLPDGWFPVTITESEIKPTKSSNNGQRLALTFTVCDGHPYAKRKVFDGLNIVNENPVAQQIAQEQLSAICHAVGVIQLQDTNQLHGTPLLIKVSTTGKRTDSVTGQTYEPKNEIKGYAKVGTQEVNMTPPPQPGNVVAPSVPAWVTQAPPAQPQQTAPAPAWAQPQAPQQPPQQPATPVPAGEGPWAQPQPASAPPPAQQPAAAPPAAAPPWAAPQPAAQPQAQPPAQPAAEPSNVPPWARGAQG